MPVYWRMRPKVPASGTVLGPLAAVPERTGRAFTFGSGHSALSMVVVRNGGAAFGYLNLCPHFSLPPNYRADRFVNADATRIVRTMHFTEFPIGDGSGVAGAGAGEGCWLDPIPIPLSWDAHGIHRIADDGVS